MGGTINWNDSGTWQRLVTCIIASGVKLDLRTIARYYGTTYNTLENRLRQVKKDADKLELGDEAEPSRTKSAPCTPRKSKGAAKKDPLSAVANGRVNKKSSPNKKRVKKEASDSPSFLDQGVDEVETGPLDPIDFGLAGVNFSFDLGNDGWAH
ncbi:hypothetical protein LTR62_007431 [Meristemomyces frigidus]|uniref:Uncharacterized protein n=1 Tax=Meristemomyces frigidus TaxID=1508187 RepID=A0AAN7TQ60_9PEZI|nr:hypothetical protein LTR62_007431 [Meristemomyces frigidus]